jgi:hypothetical protein
MYGKFLGGSHQNYQNILPDMTTVVVLTFLFTASVIFVI